MGSNPIAVTLTKCNSFLLIQYYFGDYCLLKEGKYLVKQLGYQKSLLKAA